MRYFEDLRVGETFEVGERSVTREEIVEFAAQCDPLPIHLDDEAASASIFDGLVASSIHTICLCQCMSSEQFYLDSSSLAGLGFEEVTFPTPVRPGDTLWTELGVLEKRRSETKPDRGIVHIERTMRNQHDDVVLKMVEVALFECRDTA